MSQEQDDRPTVPAEDTDGASSLSGQMLDQVAAAVEWLQAIHAHVAQQTELLAELAGRVETLTAEVESLQGQVEELNGTAHAVEMELSHLDVILDRAADSAADRIERAIEMLEISLG